MPRHPFELLRAKMSDERRRRIDARVKAMLAAISKKRRLQK